MIECQIPQNVMKYKTKFVAGFNVRQTIFLGLGGFFCVLSYLTCFSGIKGVSLHASLSACVALPFWAFGFLEPYGQPLEKVIFRMIYDNFICPATRKKETHYKDLETYEDTHEWDKKKKNGKKEEVKIKASKEFKAIK